MSWGSPLVIVPVGLALLLALARLARLRPGLRPLVGPFATVVLALGVITAATGSLLPSSPWAALVFLLPLLLLVVRANVVAFRWLFFRRRGQAPPALMESVISVVFYVVGLGAIARQWFGVELTPVLATSAVVGAVVGLALQDTLGNLFAGIALHTEAPFHVGDWVRVENRDGRIEQISWRAMRLRTWDGDVLTLPNSEVARHPVLNYSVPETPHTRILVVGAGYDTPPNRVLEALRAALGQVQGIPAEPPPGIRIIGFHEYAIHYEVRYAFASYEDYRRVEGEVYRMVWYHFRRAGIEIPYPIRDVYLHDLAERKGDDSQDRRVRALRSVDLFRPLSEDELRTVAGRLRPLRFAAGEKVFEEGSPGDSLFLIDHGEAAVVRQVGGRPREIARLNEGECFGEMALLTGQRRTATIVAATDLDLLMIDKSAFHEVMTANPAVAVDISALLAERREALTQADGDITARFETEGGRVELKARILDRMRSYFGL